MSPLDVPPRSLLVVDDHPVMAIGITHVLASSGHLTVDAHATDSRGAIEFVEQRKFDGVLVDLSLDGEDGLALVQQLRARDPSLPIVVISVHDEHVFAEQALRAGANGYVMKREPPRKLIEQVDRALSGEYAFSPAIVRRILSRASSAIEQTDELDGLTPREHEVFTLIGEGLGTRSIADRLRISGKTVESHRINIRRKLGLASSEELLRLAMRRARERSL